MDINSNFELNDSEILAIEKGPIAWAKLRQGSRMNIDTFTSSLKGQFEELGFITEIRLYDTVEGPYQFEIELQGRNGKNVFDPDRQVHEVVNNLLELPGQDKGFIPSKEGIKKLLDREPGVSQGGSHKGHGH